MSSPCNDLVSVGVKGISYMGNIPVFPTKTSKC